MWHMLELTILTILTAYAVSYYVSNFMNKNKTSILYRIYRFPTKRKTTIGGTEE